MKLNKKECQIIKTKKYARKKRLFFFLNDVRKTLDGCKKTNQGLNVMKFNFLKIFDKITNKKLKNSVFKNMKEIINGPTFFIKPIVKTRLKKNILLSCSLFLLLAVKINNKIYPATVLKKSINSINYTNGVLLFYQYSLMNLKYHTKFFLNHSK